MDQKVIKRIVELVQANKFDHALKQINQILGTDKGNQLLIQLKADVYRRKGDDLKAAEVYRDAALAGGTHSGSCWYNAAVQFQKVNKLSDAISSYKCAIELNPEHASSRNNLCVLLYNQNRSDEASQHAYWLHEKSESPEHLINAGYVLRNISQYDLSDDAFRRALNAEPDNRKYLAAALQSAQYVCDWDWLEKLKSRFMNELYLANKYDESQELHHVHVAWCDDEKINNQMAQAKSKQIIGKIVPNYSHTAHKISQRIKVGYVSSDFFNHATLHLMIGVFEHHNKNLFEITAYCHSKDDNTPYRRRFLNSIDHFRDISNLTDDEAADLIYKDKIDILIDLKGFTDKNRLKIFAKRPAPIQVTYIGFPGSLGTEFFDYAITDRYVTPDSSKPFYTEKLCRLPEVYQCNDNKRTIAINQLVRSDYKLPDNKFVFCCFNQSYKIEPIMFDAWTEIMLRVPDSVLWILDPGETALSRLQIVCDEKNINPSRIVLADKVAPPLHLKRIQEFADLALDTLIVNGHTTTSDALWAGVPVITLYGHHFNSRVSASLLSAIGLDELITHTISDYINKAVSLAVDKASLLSIKERLRSNRFIKPLFDTERFTKHFESGLCLMADLYRNSLKLDHIDVPKLPDRQLPFMNAVEGYEVKSEPDKRVKSNRMAAGLAEINQTCCVCQSERSKILRRSLFELDLEGKELDLSANWMQCASCGHIYRSAILTDAGILKLRAPAESKNLPRSVWFGMLEDSIRAKEFTDDIEHIKILDVYPEDLNFAGVAVEFGYKYTALIKPKNIDLFKKVTNSAVASDFMKVNIAGVPDIINIGNHLEITLNPINLLKRVAAILNSGGILSFWFSNCASLEWKQINESQTCGVWDDPIHNNIYKRAQLLEIVEACGFKLVNAKPLLGIDAGVYMIYRKTHA